MNKFILLVTFFALFLIGGYLFLPHINRTLGLPDLREVTEYEPISSIELYDYNDKFVGFLQAKEDRKVVALKEISPNLKRAVLAIEDKDFYSHIGVDPIGILRACFTNIKAGRVIEGGSTLTQQLVKNLLIPENERGRTFSRKFKELLLALELEQKTSKDKILELYLNQVYWGSRAFGAQRASQRYFSKQCNELSIAEAAYLAGLLQAPSALSQNLKAAKERQKEVLNRMYRFGFINKKQYEEALRQKLRFRSAPGNLELYPYYFSYVLEELSKRFDIKKLKAKGYKIYTSLDPQAQSIAERVLNEEIKNAPAGVTQFAISGIDIKSSQVRFIVGGVGNYWRNQWNRATNPHTLGSAFKPFVYLTGFQLGVIDPETVIKDGPINFPDGSGMVWSPRNFDNSFWGNITVRRALTFSRNLPAVKVARRVGIENVIQTARSCGITSRMDPNLSVSLGSAAVSPLEAAAAYATFARGGVYIKPIVIRRIEDSKGKIIEKNDPIPIRVADQQAVVSLVSILQDVVTMGTGTLAQIEGIPIAGKTGTSDKSRDVWFCGFTPDFSAAIWGGNDTYKGIGGTHVTGGAIVARVWKKVMQEYYSIHKISSTAFPKESDMKGYLIDPLTGLLATQFTPNPVKRRFYPGTEPKEYAPTPKGVSKLGSFFKFFTNSGRHNRFVEFEEMKKYGGGVNRTVSLTEEEKKELIERAKKELNLPEGQSTYGTSESIREEKVQDSNASESDSVKLDSEVEKLRKRIEGRLSAEDSLIKEEIEIMVKEGSDQTIINEPEPSIPPETEN